MNAIKLAFLAMQRLSLLATIDGQMKVLDLPLDREYRTRVMMAHAKTEAALLEIDAEIRRIVRGNGIAALEV